MNIEQTAAVLAKAAAIDNRGQSDAAILAWYEVIGDLDYQDAMAAVSEHRRSSDEYLMPIHIRRIVAASKPTTADLVAELRTRAECEHGVPGGKEMHPVGGEPLCPFCRHARRRQLGGGGEAS